VRKLNQLGFSFEILSECLESSHLAESADSASTVNRIFAFAELPAVDAPHQK
jgi:hypothetical protein